MATDNEQAAIAIFHKRPNGHFELFSVYTSGPDFTHTTGYDVDWCKRDGLYYYHMSSGGPLLPDHPMPVDGIYWSERPDIVKEQPSTLVNAASRKRNKTRRLARIPKAFTRDRWKSNATYPDIFAWLEDNGVQGSVNYCSECEDEIPDDQPCEHIWWCEEHGLWSTPSERIECICADCKTV